MFSIYKYSSNHEVYHKEKIMSTPKMQKTDLYAENAGHGKRSEPTVRTAII